MFRGNLFCPAGPSKRLKFRRTENSVSIKIIGSYKLYASIQLAEAGNLFLALADIKVWSRDCCKNLL